ncbi:hypothetical protein JY479_18040 [Serratia marcescens]|nr:hypothetical protein [Serratia marcescens]
MARSAAACQEVSTAVVWVGSQKINVMALMLETLVVVQELAQQVAAYTHSNSGTLQNAQAISAAGTKPSQAENQIRVHD